MTENNDVKFVDETLEAAVDAVEEESKKFEDKFEDFNVAAPELSFGSEEGEGAQMDPRNTQDVAAVAAAAVSDPGESLTPEEQAKVDAFVTKIDLRNSQAIMNYGVGTQKKIADFSEKALENVKAKDIGEVGDMITGLVTELKNFDVDEKEKGLKALFKKGSNNLTSLKAKYSKVETNVEAIKTELEKRQIQLMKDSAMLDKMYDMNLSYFKELTMYIAAGKQKLEQVKNVELAALQKKAEESGRQEDAQEARDMASLCERFEKKLYDLELTRTIAMQTGPQIRMVQASDNVMAEKIQSTIVNTIPLWKNQMVIAMGVEHSVQAAKAQQQVSQMTNQLLEKNADKLKTATITSAKEAEKGIVEIETLRHTNEALISTLDEVLQIQQEGRAKREAAQAELVAIESQLKEKLLLAAGEVRNSGLDEENFVEAKVEIVDEENPFA